jgi:nitrate/nitrite transport system permease protein
MASVALKLVPTPAGNLPESVAAPLLPARLPLPVRVPPPPVVRPAWREWLDARAAAILPTLLMLVVLLGVWQVACSSSTAHFPSPSKVWTESHDVIVHPLKGVSFNVEHGVTVTSGADVGILVHIATSLRRVAVGFGLAAIAGIALGVLIGQSLFAYRALDPLF